MGAARSEFKSGWQLEKNLRSELKQNRILHKEIDPRKTMHAGMNSRLHARTVAEVASGTAVGAGAYQAGRYKEYNKRGSNKGLAKRKK